MLAIGRVKFIQYDIPGLVRTNGLFSGCMAITLLLVLLALLVMGPRLLGQLDGDKATLLRDRSRLLLVQGYQEEYQDYKGHEAVLARELAYRRRLLPEELTVATIMGELQQKAHGTGVEVTGIKPSESDNGNKMKDGNCLAVELSVKGSYFKCLEFMHAIANSSQLIKISSLDAVPVKEDNKVISCRMGIIAYGNEKKL